MSSPDPLREIRGMTVDNDQAENKTGSNVKPLGPREIVQRLDASNRQKFLFEYEKRARDQSTKWQSVWEAHLLVLTILREVPSIPTLSPYRFVAVCRWEPAKEMILGEGEGEFKLVLCDEVGAHFCVVSSRIVNAEFYSEKNKKIYAELQRDILQSKVPTPSFQLMLGRREPPRLPSEIPLGSKSDHRSRYIRRTFLPSDRLPLRQKTPP